MTEIHGEGGRPPTSGLFKQKNGDKDAPYDLEEFYVCFMDSNDPTGYTCALELLVEVPLQERWREWKRLLGNSWFIDNIRNWKDDLEVKVRSSAIKVIASGSDSKSFNSLRWLAEGRPFREIKVGAPTKEERKHEDTILERVSRKINPNASNTIKELNAKET